MAVHASTETSVRQLTNQQREIAVHLGEALTATQVSLRKQIQHLQSVQDERGSQIESYFSDRLTQASQDVQNEVSQKLMLMECNMDGTISRMMEQVQKLIEDRSVKKQYRRADCRDGTATNGEVYRSCCGEKNGECAQTRRRQARGGSLPTAFHNLKHD